MYSPIYEFVGCRSGVWNKGSDPDPSLDNYTLSIGAKWLGNYEKARQANRQIDRQFDIKIAKSLL